MWLSSLLLSLCINNVHGFICPDCISYSEHILASGSGLCWHLDRPFFFKEVNCWHTHCQITLSTWRPALLPCSPVCFMSVYSCVFVPLASPFLFLSHSISCLLVMLEVCLYPYPLSRPHICFLFCVLVFVNSSQSVVSRVLTIDNRWWRKT